MNDFLGRMVERALGRSTPVAPLIASRFEPDTGRTEEPSRPWPEPEAENTELGAPVPAPRALGLRVNHPYAGDAVDAPSNFAAAPALSPVVALKIDSTDVARGGALAPAPRPHDVAESDGDATPSAVLPPARPRIPGPGRVSATDELAPTHLPSDITATRVVERTNDPIAVPRRHLRGDTLAEEEGKVAPLPRSRGVAAEPSAPGAGTRGKPIVTTGTLAEARPESTGPGRQERAGAPLRELASEGAPPFPARAEPLRSPPKLRESRTGEGTQAPPVIRVSIGRIEVRAVAPAPAPAPRPAVPRAAPTVLSLQDYLKQPRGGR